MSLSKATEAISGINEFATFFKFARSAVSYMRSRWNGSQVEQFKEEDGNGSPEEQLKEEDILQLQSDLKCLTDTVLATYSLIDRAEWRIHVPYVAQLVSELKHAVYDAEDLLDEFGWYKLKVEIEGQACQESQLPPIIDFFHSVIHGSFNKVTDIQKRLTNLSRQLEKMGLHEATPRFDKSLRPVTTSFRTEPKIFGRDNELAEVITLLGVPTHGSRVSSKRKRTSSAANNEPRLPHVPVLLFGKTTLAQEIATLQRVKSHFDNNIIWICVSDDFDEERFTKVLIKSLSGKEATTDNLDNLQRDLLKIVGKKRFLLILDDIWPDPSKKDEHHWRKFCAPLTNVLQGSTLLVTTRFAEVADIVGTMKPFALDGLKDDVFWDFFKLCVFGQEDSRIDPQLEHIGRSILLKLKGSPLAAKTIGRLLRKSLSTAHWNDVLNNELWQIEQKGTDILPALRLSYMYLPFHLKRCFSFCAVYPKDYNFKMEPLAEIWVAQGFVVPQGDIPLQHTSEQYFEDLVNMSFFQELRGKYVIHDLIHDMAQLVSKDECFILRHMNEIQKAPPNVRHLSILPSCVLSSSNMSSLGKHKKLRTLLCNRSLNIQNMERCFNELQCLRVISFASLRELPEATGSLKHLRYLEISRACHFNSFPSSFCSLYNLQILYARKVNFRKLPRGIGKLVSLQKFEQAAHIDIGTPAIDAKDLGEQIRFINRFNLKLNRRDLIIDNLGEISTNHVAEPGLRETNCLNSLSLRWGSSSPEDNNQIEVLQALHPPTSIKSVDLQGYPGQFLPSWWSLPKLSATMVNNSNGRVRTIFSSLTELSIEGCKNLSSLEEFLQPAYVPAIKKILIKDCGSLKSVPTEQFEDSASLEELTVRNCPRITHHLLAPSLKKLVLRNAGNLGHNSIECSSLTTLDFLCDHLASIILQKWSVPVLQDLKISFCGSLTSIRESEHISTELSLGSASSSTGKFPLLSQLIIKWCYKLQTLDDLLTQEYLPAIERIEMSGCGSLSVCTERFGSFSFLKYLTIELCPCVKWQSGTLLPSSLQKLTLHDCGNLSACFPGCLENLVSLKYLDMSYCKGTVSIPRDLWSSNLISLQELRIVCLADLESIGGQKAIEHISVVDISSCPKLNEVKQPLLRP